jgi:two-component system NarL family sensor kinase
VRRVPIESPQPIIWFAALRVAMVAVALASLAVFDVPNRDRLIVLVAVLAAPLALGVLLLARRSPALALHPAIALMDLAILALAEALVPSSYGAVHFLALFLVAAHAHFQGAARGVAIAAAASILLVPIAIRNDDPVSDGLLAFYETLFTASALAAGYFMGRLRTAESTGRLRARELSRRVMDAESKVRRRLAEALHDGPVQELVSLDMVLSAARAALDRGDSARADELLVEASKMAERNIGTLRDEIVSLGPYALEELTVDVAIEQCAPVWAKRFGIEVDLKLERIDLSNQLCGSLFSIAQEAVANAGRHAGADQVTVSVARVNGSVELRVRDDGHGFTGAPPFASDDPGHIGLATMRERAELAEGTLTIETGDGGTTVLVRVPYVARKDTNEPAQPEPERSAAR